MQTADGQLEPAQWERGGREWDSLFPKQIVYIQAQLVYIRAMTSTTHPAAASARSAWHGPGCCPFHALYPSSGACRFGRRVEIENLGQITSELWAALDGDDSMSAARQRVRRVLDRHGITAEEYETELVARLDAKAAYLVNPSPTHVLEYA